MSMLSSGINIGVENLKSTFENVSLYLGIIVYTAAGAKVQRLPESSNHPLPWSFPNGGISHGPADATRVYMRSCLQFRRSRTMPA